MIVNGWKLKPIASIEARKLPEGSELICIDIKRDYQTYKIKSIRFFRGVTQLRKTVSGPEMALKSSPNADWPEFPPWQQGWIWIHEMSGYTGFCTIERRAEAWEKEDY